MRTFIDGEVQWSAAEDEAELSLTWSSELMQSHATGQVIDGSGNKSVVAIRDAHGEPMVFSVGDDGDLYVIVRRRGHATGWGAFDLTGKLGVLVENVAVGQEASGAFTIVFVSRGDHRVYTTRALTNDAGAVDWENFHQLWKARAAKQVDEVTLLQAGASQMRDGGGREIGPLVLLAAREGGDQHYYQVDVDVEREPQPWKRLQLPVQANQILGVQVGKRKSGRTSPGDGVYVFSRLQEVRHLHFTTIPDREGNVRSVQLPVPPGMTSFAALPEGEERVTGLYYAGDGLHYLPPALQERENTDPRTLTQIAAPSAVSGLRGLIARDDERSIALWAVDAQKQLRYVIGSKGGAWEPPIVICRDVVQLAPIRNQVQATNDLVVIQSGGRVRRLAQDPATTVWHDQDIPVQDTGKLQTFDSYTTQITVTRADEPVRHTAFQLTASEWCQVVIDGVAHQLGDRVPLAVKTDLQGRITIIRRAEGIAPPIYRIEGGGLRGRVTVNPAQKVADGLKRLETADAIREEKRQNGKPLVTRTLTPEQRAEAADGVKQLNGVARNLPPDGSVSAGYLRGVDLAAGGQLPCWGMSITDDDVRFFEGDAAAAMMRDALSTAAFFEENDADWGVLRKIAGDVLVWLRNAAEAGFRFLVRRIDDAWQFMVQIGDDAFRFVINCIGHVYNAVNSVLKRALGLDLNDILDWVGFLFDWDDILKTQSVIANVARQAIPYAGSQIELLQREIDSAFNDFLKMVDGMKPLGREPGTVRVREETEARVHDRLPEKGKKGLEFLTRSPAGGFAGYQMQYGGVSQGGAGLTMQVDAETSDFFERTLLPFLERVQGDIQELGKDLGALFTGGGMTPDAIIQKLGSTALRNVVEAMQVLLQGMLKVFRQILTQLQQLIDSEPEIPFLSTFFRHITQGRKATPLEAFALIVAIPATAAFKIVTGKAPFAEGTGGLDTDGHVALFRKFQQPELADAGAANALRAYSLIGGGISVGASLISGSLDAAMVALGGKRPGWMSVFFDLAQIGCTVPVGNWRFGRVAGWGVRWFGPLRGLYDMAAPLELIFSGLFQIFNALVKSVFDIVKFFQEVGGRWEVVVWSAFEDLLAVVTAGFAGGGKIAPPGPYKLALAGLAAAGTVARSIVGGGRIMYLAYQPHNP